MIPNSFQPAHKNVDVEAEALICDTYVLRGPASTHVGAIYVYCFGSHLPPAVAEKVHGCINARFMLQDSLCVGLQD